MIKNKTYNLQVRVTDEENKRISKAAQALNISKSSYLRYLLKTHLIDTKMQPPKSGEKYIVLDKLTLAKIQYELRKLGQHYNQACHALNIITYCINHGHFDTKTLNEKTAECSRLMKETNANINTIKVEIEKLTNANFIKEQ